MHSALCEILMFQWQPLNCIRVISLISLKLYIFINGILKSLMDVGLMDG